MKNKIFKTDEVVANISKAMEVETISKYRRQMCRRKKTVLLLLSVLFSASHILAQSEVEVVTLYNYLHIFPEDLGEFTSSPSNVISIINNDESYGYNDWRIPTVEELALMRANNSKIRLKDADYMTSDGIRSGNVRLVSTGKTAKVKNEEQERLAEEQKKAEEERIRKLKEEPNLWPFEMASDDISSVEAKNKKYACPSGWRLPTASEMSTMCANPFTKQMLKNNIYWIEGNSGYETKEYGSTPDYSRGWSDTYLIFDAYNMNKGKIEIKTSIAHSEDSYTDGWGRYHAAQNNSYPYKETYYPCRCVRNK